MQSLMTGRCRRYAVRIRVGEGGKLRGDRNTQVKMETGKSAKLDHTMGTTIRAVARADDRRQENDAGMLREDEEDGTKRC